MFLNALYIFTSTTNSRSYINYLAYNNYLVLQMGTTHISNYTAITDNTERGPFIFFSGDFIRTFDIIINAIITPFVCVIGIVLNSVGLSLLRRDSNTNSQSFQFHMLCLLFVQTATLLLGLLRSVPVIIETYDYYLGHNIQTHWQPWVVYLDKLLNHMSTFILLAMSIERLCLLVKPFTFKEYLLTRRPKTTVFIASCVSAVYLIPFAVCLQVKSFFNTNNITEYTLTSAPPCTTYLVYVLYVETFLLRFLSPVLVLICNIAIAIAFHRVVNTKQPMSHNSASRENQLTRLTSVLLTIMILYLLLAMPDLFIQMLSFVHTEYDFDGKYKNVFFFFINLSNLFMNVNAGCAAIVYILASKRIWVIFRTRCCPC